MTHSVEAYVRGVQADHVELETLDRALRAALEEGDRAGWDARSVLSILVAQERFAEHIDRHFASEEEGGYLEEALAIAPRFGPQAAQLLKQHSTLNQSLFHLTSTAQRSRNVPAAWPRLKRQVNELLEKLEAHEAAENRILQAAFNVDLEIPD